MERSVVRKKRRRAKDPDTVIRTKGLVKVFGDLRAVDGLDLEVRRGQLYGLLGPNGSGKTTAIRMIMGLLRINGGTAEVLGKRMPNKETLRKIGYMPQDTAIYREITVHDNIVLFGEMYQVPRDIIDRREVEVLKLVNLPEWRNEIADNLSGGMMHRLSLAMCLIHDPDVLFLDEPTVGVDPELRDNLWGYLKNLSKKGKTIVITTHYIEEARNCDLVGLMRNGKIIAEDRPINLMARAGSDTLEEAFLYFTRRLKRREAFAKSMEAGKGEREGEEE